jgi:hypothetical protein
LPDRVQLAPLFGSAESVTVASGEAMLRLPAKTAVIYKVQKSPVS